MPHSLREYTKVIGKRKVKELKEEAKELNGLTLAHVNSTLYGGGVAEILASLTYLMNDVGIEAEWRVLRADNEFFNVTKSFHNALQGQRLKLSNKAKKIYLRTNKEFAKTTRLERYNFVVIHDPQPLACIKFYRRFSPWVWRCHIDLSKPNASVFNFLKQFIAFYDHVVISNEKFAKNIKRIKPYTIIYPSIDPLSPKNMPLKKKEIESMLNARGIALDKPIVSQISRFDPWKDPIGVLRAFKLVRKRFDCQLVLLGNLASDDPEGELLYKKVLKESAKMQDVHIILEHNDLLVNALQRASAVVVQKSIREGFGLTVSEALWKGKAVVAGNAGGIPLQIINGKNGFLVNSVEECAAKILFLLKNPEKAKLIGKYGKAHVKKNFLITRHLLDYIRLIKKLISR